MRVIPLTSGPRTDMPDGWSEVVDTLYHRLRAVCPEISPLAFGMRPGDYTRIAHAKTNSSLPRSIDPLTVLGVPGVVRLEYKNRTTTEHYLNYGALGVT